MNTNTTDVVPIPLGICTRVCVCSGVVVVWLWCDPDLRETTAVHLALQSCPQPVYISLQAAVLVPHILHLLHGARET